MKLELWISLLLIFTAEIPLSPTKRVMLREVRIQSSSSDYASISSIPDNELIREPPPGNLQHIVSSLKSRLMQHLKYLNRQQKIEDESEAPPPLPPKPAQEQECMVDDHVYVNTGPGIDSAVNLTEVQMKLSNLQQTVDTPKRPNPLKAAGFRARAQTCTPLIMAKRKTSSYTVLNVDDIWQYQLDHRYAPLSVMQRKGTSLRSRKSYIRDRRMHTQQQKMDHQQVEHRVSDYEVPLSLPGVSGSVGRIPPPLQLLTSSRSQAMQQDAMITHDQGDYDSLIPQDDRRRHDSDDYDYVAVDEDGEYNELEEDKKFKPAVLLSARSVPCLPMSLECELQETSSLPPSPVMTPLEKAIADLELAGRKAYLHKPAATNDETSEFETSV